LEFFTPHGQSYLWTPAILWVSVVADLIIAISFISLPGVLMYFARNREGLPLRWTFVVFGVFIVALAGGHAFQAWNTWHADYAGEAFVKAITAVGAIGTASALWPLLRRTLQLPSPQQLAAANESLRAEIRTREQAERVLQEQARELGVARDAAQAANRAKSQFLTNMSHEIRTPLNAVIGFSEILLHTELTEEQRDHLCTVIDSGGALLAVVNDILDYSRIEAGKIELENVAFDVDDVVGDTLRSLAIRAEQKGLELSCQLDADVPRALRGDPGRLRQVIANLVSNAITFTEHGEVEVRVAREAPGVLRFSVRDTGIGIDAADIDRLFESFEQADKSSSRRFGGTGLGLSISRGLVALLGGTIGAQSTPGAGSTFTFTARFAEVGPPAGDRTRGAVPRVLRAPFPTTRRVSVLAGGDERAAAQLAPQRILLVEDSIPNQKVALAILQSQGHEVVVASDGHEGLERFGSREFDVVLMDIQMPGMDGFACTAAIRAAEARTGAHIPIIAMTAHALAGDREKCLAAGMDDYVSKPIRRDDLFRALASAIAARGRSAARVPRPSTPASAR
jgi:signal transduction histidine kinase/ActR/RegA family two-component response regulator